MPHTARKSGSRWAIVNKITGKVKGYSESKRKAKAAARIRDEKAEDE